MRKADVKQALSVALEQTGNEDQITELFSEYFKCNEFIESGGTESEHVYRGTSALDIARRRGAEHTIALSPPNLNSLAGGGVLRKHHILLFARPDAGKTTQAIELVNGFLKQDLTVLYLGNEDPPEDILVRMMCRITGMRVPEILTNPEAADELLAQRNWDKLIFVEMSPGSASEIYTLVDQVRPDVLMVDQIVNVNMGIDNQVLSQGRAEQFIRNLGKKFNMLTISFAQAGGSAHNKLILEQTDVEFSNTQMQAQADLMIGMGMTLDMEQTGERMLMACKNKMQGGIKDPTKIQIDHSRQRING